jgi:hypothetical protein
MLEGFTLAGAIVAFVTGLFTVWDRWARGRPLAWVTKQTLRGVPFRFIRIKNPGPGDVFVRGVRAYGGGYGVFKTQSVGDLAFKPDVHVLLRRDAEHDVPLKPMTLTPPIISAITGNSAAQMPRMSRRICFVVSWRKTSSTWLPQFPILLITSTGEIEHISSASDPDRVDDVPINVP